MRHTNRTMIAALLGGLFFAAPMANAAITFTGQGGDLTFFYDSVANRWDVVFRDKGSVQATGLDNAYGGYTGIQGTAPAGQTDYTFDTLQINVTSSPLIPMGGIDYLVTPANGSTYQNGGSVNQPDLGIRTRLREDLVDGVVQQFTHMRMSLDWVNSNRPAGADFIMFRTNAITNVTEVLYDTANEQFSHDWVNWDHQHFHFGFSEVGDYELAFTIDGIGGAHGADDTPEQFTLNFTVIPEPSTALLGMAALGMLGLRRRRERSCTPTSEFPCE